MSAAMDRNGEPEEQRAVMLSQEELPQMDGSCDACEPDEAQPATEVCHTCGFAFCPLHADKHAGSTRHALAPYSHEETQANGDVAGAEAADGTGAPLGVAAADGGVSGDAEGKGGAQKCPPQQAEPGEGAEGAEAGAEAAGEGGDKRETVTVERLRCKEHGQEGSLYCKPDEKIICVVCAVQGEHRGHEIITLYEAYVWQKNRQGYDLLSCTQQMGEKIRTKWTNPEMTTEELEAYVNAQFDELRQLVILEEKRTLHLVDLKEAFLTASAVEKIAEITAQTEKLQEEMANITHQLCMLEQAEALAGPAVAAEALVAGPGPAHRVLPDIEARPRLPEPRADPVNRLDFEDNDSGPSMDHAP
ncbi:tripartite motif-containing protein 44 [Mugil cephalus]|uniref:tripartite motif-containing protein 44 n=1 Tax=Mugil cephalus TaxID=48193 RepID=UPI001FB7C12E|nr:tripartite motif-containing protein 44 [Mugil cephalus]XP_047453024.1 tripartite motif-containing protein 44 [Mugil cephalus]XP_047453025.1 tripartite motif-containing protein 44 [Mugil cephalus]XP_047453026.1 tripartite motif-containing protein 44 [Mugil cephalus]